MIAKLKRWWNGGPRPAPTLADVALMMAGAHMNFMKCAASLEAEIAKQRADIEAAQARLAALQPPKAKP